MAKTGLIGAEEFMEHRNTLAHDRLDLEKWHAFQELYYREPLKFGEALIRFKLGERAHLVALFRADKNSKAWGLRISRTPQMPSACLKPSSWACVVGDTLRLSIALKF